MSSQSFWWGLLSSSWLPAADQPSNLPNKIALILKWKFKYLEGLQRNSSGEATAISKHVGSHLSSSVAAPALATGCAECGPSSLRGLRTGESMEYGMKRGQGQKKLGKEVHLYSNISDLTPRNKHIRVCDFCCFSSPFWIHWTLLGDPQGTSRHRASETQQIEYNQQVFFPGIGRCFYASLSPESSKGKTGQSRKKIIMFFD